MRLVMKPAAYGKYEPPVVATLLSTTGTFLDTGMFSRLRAQSRGYPLRPFLSNICSIPERFFEPFLALRDAFDRRHADIPLGVRPDRKPGIGGIVHELHTAGPISSPVPLHRLTANKRAPAGNDHDVELQGEPHLPERGLDRVEDLDPALLEEPVRLFDADGFPRALKCKVKASSDSQCDTYAKGRRTLRDSWSMFFFSRESQGGGRRGSE